MNTGAAQSLDFRRALAHNALERLDAGMEFKPTLTEAWAKFGDFHDSLIKRIELALEPAPWDAVVELEGTADSPDLPWYFIRFEFTGVQEWRFDQARNLGPTTIVFEASWAQLGDLFYVTFDGVNVDSDAPTVEMFRASDTYIAAKSVEVTLRPIR